MKGLKFLSTAILLYTIFFIGPVSAQPWIWSGTEDHPLANFAVESLYISMGETGHITVYVRNINDTFADNVTAELLVSESIEEYLEFALINQEDVTWANLTNNKTLVARLGPQEIKPLLAVINPIETGRYTIVLNATSEISPLIEDIDMVFIVIRYPFTFPGLDFFAVLVLFALAVILYDFSLSQICRKRIEKQSIS